MPFVFLSYSRGDKSYVQSLRTYLKRHDIDAWADDDIDYGTAWAAVIQQQIESCSALVPVVTPMALASEWVDREIGLAQELKRPVLPLLLKKSPPSIRLASLQQEDVTGAKMPSDGYLRQVRKQLGLTDIDPALLRAPKGGVTGWEVREIRHSLWSETILKMEVRHESWPPGAVCQLRWHNGFWGERLKVRGLDARDTSYRLDLKSDVATRPDGLRLLLGGTEVVVRVAFQTIRRQQMYTAAAASLWLTVGDEVIYRWDHPAF